MSKRKYLEALARYETADEYAERLAEILEYTRERYTIETPQQRGYRSRTKRERRVNESAQQREKRITRAREIERKCYAYDTLDEREESCAKLRVKNRQRRARETPQQRERRVARQRERSARETPRRERRFMRERKRNTKRCLKKTPEQRRKRLASTRKRNMKRRAEETPEHREKRLLRAREYWCKRGRLERAKEFSAQRENRRLREYSRRQFEIFRYKARRHKRIRRERCLFGATLPIRHTPRCKLYRSRTVDASSGTYIVTCRTDFAPVCVRRHRRYLHHGVHTPDEIVMRRRQRHSSMMNQT